jgi:hypothetical protein
MTLTGMLSILCFIVPPLVGIDAGMEAGGVGGMIGIGVGLGAGGLAYYALEKMYEYMDKLEARRDSQAQVVLKLMNSGSGFIMSILFLGPVLLTHFFTKFIVHLMAG